MNEDQMNVGDVYDRKNSQHKIVAKVEHESDEGRYIYLIATRNFGSEEVEYYHTEMIFGGGFKKTDYWLG